MPANLAIASDLARVVLLVRDQPGAVEDQKAALRLLLTSVGTRGFLLTVDRDGLWLDGTAVPADFPGARDLHALLHTHHVGEIRIPSSVMSSALIALVRVLAAPSGTYSDVNHLVARLDAAGGGIIRVAPPVLEATSAAAMVPEAAPVPGTPPIARPDQVRTSKEDHLLHALGPDAMSEQKVGMMHFLTLEQKAVGKLDELVHRLEAGPSGKESVELLNALVAAGDKAAQDRDYGALLKAASAIIALEAKAGGAADQRSYGIALRRMLPKSTIEPLAKLAGTGPGKADAIAVLRRMGADATEALLHLLVHSSSAAERRGYYHALTQMSEGTGLLINMLSHDEWFVARNLADLCGELKLEGAVPALAKLVNHEDERVRRSAVGALARIGIAGSAEPLRQALKDLSPIVRLEAAQGIDRRMRALAMPLAVAVEEESKADVHREMLRALGRIGTPEAVQALSKAAEPGGKILRRKPVAQRLAAVEGLGLAGSTAVSYLRHLLQDDVAEVREAAQRALTAVSESKPKVD